LPQQNMMNDVRLFSRVLVLGKQHAHQQETIDTSVKELYQHLINTTSTPSYVLDCLACVLISNAK